MPEPSIGRFLLDYLILLRFNPCFVRFCRRCAPGKSGTEILEFFCCLLFLWWQICLWDKGPEVRVWCGNNGKKYQWLNGL
jgi:hypothetical protein